MSVKHEILYIIFGITIIFSLLDLMEVFSQDIKADQGMLGSTLSSKNEHGKKFVLGNIKRNDIIGLIREWEKNTNTKLSVKLEDDILREYILAEESYMKPSLGTNAQWNDKVRKEGLKVLYLYLNKIMDGIVSTSIGCKLGVELDIPISCRPEFNTYGRLKVDCIPEKTEVYINNKFVEYSDKEFILVTGKHIIVVKKPPVYVDFNTSATIEPGKIFTLKCELRKVTVQ